MSSDRSESDWWRIHTTRVMGRFVEALARTHKWNSVYIISPWISEFGNQAGMSFDQFIKRLIDDDATAYVVTRPASEDWHERAIQRIAATRQANIVLLSDLHTKLYCARTAQGDFALLGSANFTHKSLENRELGVLVQATGAGKLVYGHLLNEAAEIFRATGRRIHTKRSFDR